MTVARNKKVPDVGAIQYFVEKHPQCLSQASDLNGSPVRLCGCMVHLVVYDRPVCTGCWASNSGSSGRTEVPKSACYHDDRAARILSGGRPYRILTGYQQDRGVSGTHYQSEYACPLPSPGAEKLKGNQGMSPLFTVAAYRFLFQIHYSTATYLSLIPLTLGVMLACSVEFRGNFFGVMMAFTGAIIFVSQNIFSKKLFNESSIASDLNVPIHRRKLDKLNLLCYSGGQAFLLTIPLWLYSEGYAMLSEYHTTGVITLSEKVGKHGQVPLTGWELVAEFVFNGTVHFAQNIIAFVLLSLVSPVTYSVASLVKRIFVILMAIAWFGSPTTKLQGAGIFLTYVIYYSETRVGANGTQVLGVVSIRPGRRCLAEREGIESTAFETGGATTTVKHWG